MGSINRLKLRCGKRRNCCKDVTAERERNRIRFISQLDRVETA